MGAHESIAHHLNDQPAPGKILLLLLLGSRRDPTRGKQAANWLGQLRAHGLAAALRIHPR
eukprot:7403147-Pyramimonas_sp.AAC.1